MLGTAGDFLACQRGFKESFREKRTRVLRMPFSEDHHSDHNGAGFIASAS